MAVNIILKIHLKQEQASIFHQVFQCQQYLHLETKKRSMMYAEVKICEFLREHATKIINLKKTKLSTKEQQKSCENAKICYIYKRKFENKYFKDKKYLKA